MTMGKQSHLSTGCDWFLFPYVQFTSLVLNVVQFNAQSTLYMMECYFPSLKLGTDVLHILHALIILLMYTCVSYVVYKKKSTRFCIASGCLAVAVVCVLMGSNIFTSHPLRRQTVPDTRENITVGDDSNSSICQSILPFDNIPDPAWSSPWEGPWDLPILTALAVQILVVYGVAVHFVAGMILVDGTSGGKRSPVVLALLLMAPNSAAYIGSMFSPLVAMEPKSSEIDWAALWSAGWAPLGVTLLFLMPPALWLVMPSAREQSGLSHRVTSSDTTRASSGNTGVAVDEDKEAGEDFDEDLDEYGRGFFQSAVNVLKSRIVLSNLLSQLFISAGLTGVEQIQHKLTTLLRGRPSAEGDPSIGDYLVKYSADLNTHGSGLSMFLTGCIIFKRRPEPRRLVTWMVMVLLFMLIFVIMFLRHFNTSAGNRNFKLSLHAAPGGCKCETLMKQATPPPVCSLENSLYMSPCHASCEEICSGPNRTQYFTGCSALASNSSILSSDQCASDTGWEPLVWFLGILTVVKSLVSSGRVIGVFVSLRCVSGHDTPISLGLVTALTSLVSMLDRQNLYARYITELTCLAILSTSLTWYIGQHLQLYNSIETSTHCLHNSRSRKQKGPSVNAEASNSSSRHENSSLLPRESIVDEAELLDVRIMSRQRDSIDMTKVKRLRSGKRFSLDYRKRSMPNFKEHDAVYP